MESVVRPMRKVVQTNNVVVPDERNPHILNRDGTIEVNSGLHERHVGLFWYNRPRFSASGDNVQKY